MGKDDRQRGWRGEEASDPTTQSWGTKGLGGGTGASRSEGLFVGGKGQVASGGLCSEDLSATIHHSWVTAGLPLPSESQPVQARDRGRAGLDLCHSRACGSGPQRVQRRLLTQPLCWDILTLDPELSKESQQTMDQLVNSL